MGNKSRMPRLKELVERYREEHGASEGWVAEKIGLERGGLWAWWNRGLSQMPTADVLYLLATVTRNPYRDVLDAALHDFGYLPEAVARTITVREDADDESVPVDLSRSERRPS